jgi:WD40 repeat protein
MLAFGGQPPRLLGLFHDHELRTCSLPTLQVESRIDSRKILSPHFTGSTTLTTFAIGPKRIAAGGADGTVKLFDAATASLRGDFWGDDSRVLSLAFTPDETLLGVGTRNGQVRVLRIPDGTVMATLAAHRQAVTAVAFSHDGQLFATASAGQGVLLWERQNDVFQRIATLPVANAPLALRFSRNSRQLVALLKDELATRVWNLGRLEEQFREVGLR